MAKRITVGAEEIKELREEFEKKLASIKAADGKFKFEKDLGKIDKKAEVVFDGDTFAKMKTLIACTDKEVGWHCLARKVEPNEEYASRYEVYGIMVYPQEVTGSTVNTNKEEFDMWLYQRPDEEFNNIRFHGHSHVDMTASPSSVDKTMYEDWLGDLQKGMPNQFYIFSIWNRKGDCWMNIYDLEDNVLYESKDVDVKWRPDGLMEFISDAEDMVKVSKPKPVTAKQTNYGGVTYVDHRGYPTYEPYGGYGYYGVGTGKSYAANYPEWED